MKHDIHECRQNILKIRDKIQKNKLPEYKQMHKSAVAASLFSLDKAIEFLEKASEEKAVGRAKLDLIHLNSDIIFCNLTAPELINVNAATPLWYFYYYINNALFRINIINSTLCQNLTKSIYQTEPLLTIQVILENLNAIVADLVLEPTPLEG